MQLAPYEQTELERHEATIERGIKTFVEVGNALLAIRDKKLYRKYGTFEEYCQKRWGWTRQRTYQLMGAAQVVENLSTRVDILPTSEKEARPLVALTPDQQREAWQGALETAPNGKITGAHVQTVVDRLSGNGDDQPPADEFDDQVDADPSTGELPISEPATVNPLPSNIRAYKNSSDSNEWYTPRWLIEKALTVMGGIDLDPASSLEANKTVLASKIYTIDDNALLQDWHGRVWLNPPYGDAVELFVNKLIGSVESGDVNQAVLLVAARTDTAWFRKLREYPRCFIWGRLKFINGVTGESGDPAGFPSMAVYVTMQEPGYLISSGFQAFVREFKTIGDIYTWWKE